MSNKSRNGREKTSYIYDFFQIENANEPCLQRSPILFETCMMDLDVSKLFIQIYIKLTHLSINY